MEIFDYDNVLLLPRKCRVESRSECDAGVELGGRKFRLPVVPANMKTVVDVPICTWLAKNGYFYVMHRFDLDNVQFVRDMRAAGVFASISLGVAQAELGHDSAYTFVITDLCHYGGRDLTVDSCGVLFAKLFASGSSFGIGTGLSYDQCIFTGGYCYFATRWLGFRPINASVFQSKILRFTGWLCFSYSILCNCLWFFDGFKTAIQFDRPRWSSFKFL